MNAAQHGMQPTGFASLRSARQRLMPTFGGYPKQANSFGSVDDIPQAEYSCGMKVKTSITLSDELLKAIDKYGRAYKNRSDFIEAAIWAFIGQIIRERQNARDIEIINRNAERLNAEAQDVLAYQVSL